MGDGPRTARGVRGSGSGMIGPRKSSISKWGFCHAKQVFTRVSTPAGMAAPLTFSIPVAAAPPPDREPDRPGSQGPRSGRPAPPDPTGGAARVRSDEPGAAPDQPVGALRWTRRIHKAAYPVASIPVLTPFPHIPMHVLQPERVLRFLASRPGLSPGLALKPTRNHRQCLQPCLQPRCLAPGIARIPARPLQRLLPVTGVIGRGCPGPAGVFPLCFAGQAKLPLRRKLPFLPQPLRQGNSEGRSFIPGHAVHRQAAAFEMTRIVLHQRFPLRLRRLRLRHPEPSGQGHRMLDFIRLHQKGARRTPAEGHLHSVAQVEDPFLRSPFPAEPSPLPGAAKQEDPQR